MLSYLTPLILQIQNSILTPKHTIQPLFLQAITQSLNLKKPNFSHPIQGKDEGMDSLCFFFSSSF